MSQTDDPPWYSTFNDIFWLTLAGTIMGGVTMVVNAILKSRCREFRCFGISCTREPAPVGEEPQVELEAVQVQRPPTRA